MLSHEYETILILRPELDEGAIGTIVEKLEGVVTSGEGHILDRDDWGKRKLAYPIEKQLKGHYIRMNYLSTTDIIAEIERRIRIEDGIVRFMTVRLANAVDVSTRVEEAAVTRAKREEEAKRRAEAEAEAEARSAAMAAEREAEAASKAAAAAASAAAAAAASASDTAEA